MNKSDYLKLAIMVLCIVGLIFILIKEVKHKYREKFQRRNDEHQDHYGPELRKQKNRERESTTIEMYKTSLQTMYEMKDLIKEVKEYFLYMNTQNTPIVDDTATSVAV